MISYEESRNVSDKFPGDAPLETIVEFYRTNGFRLEEHRREDGTDEGRAVLERRPTSGGAWSSNTARRPVRVEILERDGSVRIRYNTEGGGPPITERDRKFWRREMRAAANSARNPSRRPHDLRHEAAVHAEQVRRQWLSWAICVLLGLMSMVLFIDLFGIGGSI